MAHCVHRRNLIYVFPEGDRFEEVGGLFELQNKISYAVKSISEGFVKVAEFSGIQKKLTMHIARHTFDNISGDKMPIQMLQELYRHTSITTTIANQSNFIHKDMDDALDSVVNF